jgi:hypothetical protein
MRTPTFSSARSIGFQRASRTCCSPSPAMGHGSATTPPACRRRHTKVNRSAVVRRDGFAPLGAPCSQRRRPGWPRRAPTPPAALSIARSRGGASTPGTVVDHGTGTAHLGPTTAWRPRRWVAAAPDPSTPRDRHATAHQLRRGAVDRGAPARARRTSSAPGTTPVRRRRSPHGDREPQPIGRRRQERPGARSRVDPGSTRHVRGRSCPDGRRLPHVRCVAAATVTSATIPSHVRH